MTTTMADFPVLRKVTLNLVPNGRLGEAAVNLFLLNKRPLLVFLPSCRFPYHDAIPTFPDLWGAACAEISDKNRKVLQASLFITPECLVDEGEPKLIELEMSDSWFNQRLLDRSHTKDRQDPVWYLVDRRVMIPINRDWEPLNP